jgi:methylmalonyl-CoA epimerase
MLTKIEHIGIAVKDLEKSLFQYESILGLKVKEIEEVNVGDVNYRVAFIPVGEMNIELVHTKTKSGIVFDWLETHGEGVYHLAYEVEDLEETFNYLLSKGVFFVWNEIKKGSRGTRIALIKPDEFNGVYIELVQKK